MRIDFISASLKGGGAERVITLLANYLESQGHQVSIITFNDEDAYPLNQNVRRVRLHDGKIPNHTLRSLSNLISYYTNKRNRPDIAISSIRRNNFSAIIACKLFSIKIIASEHSNHLMRYELVGNFTWNYLYRYANYITVLTAFDKAFFEKKGARVVVMPNPTTFTPLKTNQAVRDNVILAVGKLDNYKTKGFDNLIELISPILKKYPDWVLKIVGAGEKRGFAFLNNLIKVHGLENQVFLTGFRNDVKTLMLNSKIFVLSSRSEGLPMVLLEAMSQGMACISYDCVTGPSEIIEHEKNGLLIENQNMTAMQKGLVKLIDDEALRNMLAENALGSLDKFSIENIAKKWEALFEEIVQPQKKVNILLQTKEECNR